MSASKIRGATLLGNKALDSRNSPQPWIRNPSWPALPSVSGLQKMVGLVAIYPDANFLAINCAGNYTVDWGDGSSENVSSGVQANHQYTYSNAALDNTNAPVTFTASTSTVNRTGHGYTDGMPVRFYSIATTTGINENTQYYVINATANTFQIAATKEGSAVTLTNDGTANLLPYKVALVQVTGNGANLTSINLSVKHSQTGLNTGSSSNWLDVSIEGALTTLTVTGTTLQSLMERFQLVAPNLTTISGGLANCTKLQSVSLTTGTLTVFPPFTNCYSLQEAPDLTLSTNIITLAHAFNGCTNLRFAKHYNTPLVTDFSYTFANCNSLEEIPVLNTSSGTTFVGMFQNCWSLKELPFINTSGGGSFANFADGCGRITSVPPFNLTSATNCSYMFASCRSLKKVPDFSSPNATNYSYMFYNCTSLTNAPNLNTAGATNMASMFSTCSSLTTVPFYNTSNVTDMSNMFSGASKINQLPLWDTSKVTTFNGFLGGGFTALPLLQQLPPLNMTASTNNSNFVYTPYSLCYVPVTNIKSSISFASAKLSATQINYLLGQLLGGNGAQTLTLSSNWGITAPVSLSGTTTQGSTTVTMANTAGINVGDTVTGTGTPLTTARTASATSATVTLTAHGLQDGDLVSFTAITTSPLATLNVPYYVVNSAANTFQISATQGGSVTAVTGGSGVTIQFKWDAKVAAITPNTNITLTRPATSSATNTLSFRALDISLPMLKGWALTGL